MTCSLKRCRPQKSPKILSAARPSFSLNLLARHNSPFQEISQMTSYRIQRVNRVKIQGSFISQFLDRVQVTAGCLGEVTLRTLVVLGLVQLAALPLVWVAQFFI
jgi:hypothetical protein